MIFYNDERKAFIKNCNNKYIITDYGRIYSVKSRKFLIQYINCHGYCIVSIINKFNKKITYKTHRLVGEYFIDNKNNYEQINHIDGIKTNNYYKNLEWCTPLQNTQHAIENNLFKINNKKKFHNIYYDKSVNRWKIRLTFNKEYILYKTFKTKIEAAVCYNNFIINNGIKRRLIEIND